MKKTLSVCMVLFNRWEDTKKTLDSIQTTVPLTWEIEWCLVDNGSHDETPVKIVEYLKFSRGRVGLLTLLPTSEKQTMAVNRTMNAASGEYMLRTDNDIQYSMGWFEDCMDCINDEAFTDLGFVCPTHHLRQVRPDYKPNLVDGNRRGCRIDMVSKLNMNVPGNLFMKTSVARDIGGFYTPFNLLHADVHFCMIAKHMGYSFGYTWNTQSLHVGEVDLSQEYSQRSVHERRTENARYEAICKGDHKDKHPMEIEFAQKLTKMTGTIGKRLPVHKNINVLIPCAGRRVELVKMFKEVFSIPRWNGKVFTAGIDDYMPASFFGDGHFLMPSIHDPTYIDRIISICIEHNIRYIFPTIDHDLKVLSENKMRILREAKTEVVAPDYENALICLDKSKTYSFFKEMGINTPKTFSSVWLARGNGKMIQKPIMGFASKNVTSFDVEFEDSGEVPANYIVQEFIEGKEYTVDIVTNRLFEIVSLVARERFTTRGGEISTGQVVNHLHLYGEFAKIAQKLELIGPWNVQYIITPEGIPYFIEINSRFGGGVPISARAGQNQALISLKILERDFFGYHYRYLVEWGLTAMRYDQAVYGHLSSEKGDHDVSGERRLKG